jgi:glycogen debranching enzyme
MNEGMVSILDGSTFVVSSANGDIEAKPDQPHGLFFKDTRHLSHWVLTLNDTRLDVLSTDTIEYYFAQFFCFLPTGTIYTNPEISVIRRRLVGEGFLEEIIVINHDSSAHEFELRVEADTDFADLFEVKDALPKKGEYYREQREGCLILGYRREHFVRETILEASIAPNKIEGRQASFQFTLQPNSTWKVELQVKPVTGEVVHRPKYATWDRRIEAKPYLHCGLQEWIHSAPDIIARPGPIQDLYLQSLLDLAALRFHPDILPQTSVPAAGLPWFMALFGRDSLITSYQTLPFIPELSATTLRVLAATQGKVVDDFREEEPGRILHELRVGEMTVFKERPHSPYYGTSDATPLFLVLLDEYERWTGDAALVRELEPSARAALNWIDQYGDRDRDGYVEYERKTSLGLENQCWKDSWNSILFSDRTLAPTPRATCEIQGYVYDAKKRCARLARAIWGDAKLAEQLEVEADSLKERFNKDFWIENRQFFAVALDGKKRKVDSLTSNIGHLLWSGIVEDDKVEPIVNHLMGPQLFSGWGVRTMAEGEAGYNPMGYHNGTVWPHDNSIIAAGLRRYGYRKEAGDVVSGIFLASRWFGYRLPEVFAGYDRWKTGYPVQYPTASSPQAWAAGAPMLGMRVLLGMEPKENELSSDPLLPDWIGTLALKNVPGRWGRIDVVANQKSALSSVQQLVDRFFAERRALFEPWST